MDIKQALASCQKDAVLTMIREQLDAGTPPEEVLAKCNEGMVLLGQRFDDGEVFIPDLMFGGMLMKQIMGELEPLLAEGQKDAQAKGTVVIGTVQHDVHDIGKDIVAMVLSSAGFNVIDLGVDVAPEKFVTAIQEHQPQIIAMSLLLTTCYKSVISTVEAITEAGLRDSVKICVGGAAASELVAERSGCDFYGKTAIDSLNWSMQVV